MAPDASVYDREAIDGLVAALKRSGLHPHAASSSGHLSWTFAVFVAGIVFCLGCLVAGWLTLQRSERLRRRVEGATRAAREGVPLESLRALFGADLPTWLSSPDVSRMDWANTALEGMWSQVGAAAVKWAVLEGNLQHLLNSTTFWRPAWLASSGITVQGLSLGHVPPVITGVTAYKREENTLSDRVMLDFNFSWSSKMNARMDVQVLPSSMKFPVLGSVASFLTRRSIVKVVVRDLAASGTIRAQLRPLMNKIPVVGAVKISFLGAPTFTYKVSSYGINPMFIPGLETFINSFITGQVLQPFTYPDGFVVKLDPSAGDVASELPEGLLTVTLKEATGVPRMDFIGGADPYVKLWVNETLKMHSTVKSRTRHPVWNEDFRLTVHDYEHQALRFIVYDSDAFRRDDEIGRTELLLKDLDLSEPRDITLLIPRTGKKEARTQSDSMGFQKAQVTAASDRHELAVRGERSGKDVAGAAPGTAGARPRARTRRARLAGEDEAGWWVEQPDGTGSHKLSQRKSARRRQGAEDGAVAPGSGDAAAAPAAADATDPADPAPPPVNARPSTGLGKTLRTLQENTSGLGVQARDAFGKLADDSLELLGVSKRCELHVRLAYTPFDRASVLQAIEDSKLGAAPGAGAAPRSPRAEGSITGELRRVFSGGVLYVYLDHGTDLYSKSLEGYTKNMRCRLTVGRRSRETESSRSKLLDRKNPVFDQKLELILDGDEVDAAREEIIRVDLFTHHLLRKPLYKGHVAVPLQEVIRRGQVQGAWPMQGVPHGQLTMTLTWVSALSA